MKTFGKAVRLEKVPGGFLASMTMLDNHCQGIISGCGRNEAEALGFLLLSHDGLPLEQADLTLVRSRRTEHPIAKEAT